MKKILLHDENKLKKINPETIAIFNKYKIDMVMRNLSEKTQQHYIWDLQQWFIWVLDNQDNKSVMELTDEDITAFIYFCMQQGNNAERIKVRLATISAFYKYMRKKRLIKENPTEFIDRPKRAQRITVQTYLTQEQVAAMREKLIGAKNLELRLYAMLSLSTMARVSAIASIRWNQIDMERKMIIGVREKENKIVDLFFSDEVKCLLLILNAYRGEHNIKDNGYVFRGKSYSNKPISSATLYIWCKQIGHLIGVETLHPHDFRHSGATLLKNAGMPLEDVSTLLSHESTDTTKKYYIKQDTARISSMKAVYNI